MTKYLSSRKLKIKPWERKALIELVDVLPTMAHIKESDLTEGEAEEAKPVFNLNYTARPEYSCGTVCCIGGWVKVMDFGINLDNPALTEDQVDEADSYVKYDRSKVLGDLYYPRKWNIAEWDHITPSEAAAVIEHFLETGIVDYGIVGYDFYEGEEEDELEWTLP